MITPLGVVINIESMKRLPIAVGAFLMPKYFEYQGKT